jgi:lipoprotein-anchoring transpeptidase ErfK/SrfK
MKTSSLESKTVRSDLMRYSFYASGRPPLKPGPKLKNKRHKGRFMLPLLVILILGGGATYAFKPSHPVAQQTVKAPSVAAAKQAPVTKTAPAIAAAPTNYCAGNTLNHFVKVSISQRHLWACQASDEVYDSAVVTGIEYLAADRTPVGTYHVYAKYTNTVLRGSDSTGSWDDPVSYWMPFLDNQYGQYGLHDATWRSPSAFGNIDPNSADASHGCVELPLATAKWLYDWAPIGTTVTVQS